MVGLQLTWIFNSFFEKECLDRWVYMLAEMSQQFFDTFFMCASH